MAPIKASELRNQDRDTINGKLQDLRTELSELRVAKVTGGAPSKLAKIRTVRRSIARVLTVMNEKTRANVRVAFAKKKCLPLDLRAKKTRAIRQRLTKKDAGRMTLKQHKKKVHFSQR